LRSVTLVLEEATATAHDSRTAMLMCAGKFGAPAWYYVEYLAVENGLRVEDLRRQASAFVCATKFSANSHTGAAAMKLMRQREKDCTPNETTTNLGSTCMLHICSKPFYLIQF